MRKGKVVEKFKRILISIMCVVTLVFAMPVKAKANIVEDFFSLFAYLGDVPMWLGNVYLDPYETDNSYYDFNNKGANFGASDEGGIRNFSVTPYDIFTSGMKVNELNKKGEPTGSYYIKLPILASNFFSSDYLNDGVTNSAEILRPVIANIYKQLRNLCLVLMMLVLVYIGIKIILSSVAAEQAKYKQWLVDWLVSLCLLFAMHYIMSFLMNINEVILNMLKNDEGDSYYVSLGEQGDGMRKGSDWVTAFNDAPEFAKLHLDIPDQNFSGGSSGFWTLKDNDQPFSFDESTHIIQVDTRTDWGDNGKVKINAEIYDKDRPQDRHRAVYKANLVEFVRTISDYGGAYVTIYNNNNEKKDLGSESGDDSFISAAYVTLYLLLVVETIMFAITYLKRVFQLAFFTMIAPIVAFMYPIDKIGDGKAQAFNNWLKDYIFNVLIQPLHLLIYTIFIVAARDLFAENIIYAIAIYGMMIYAEKYFKKIFGFDKSSTGGGGPLGGALGAGMAMSGLNKLTGLGPPGPPGGGKKASSGEGNKPKIKKRPFTKDNADAQKATNGNEQLPGASGGKMSKVKNKFKNGAKSLGNAVWGTGKSAVGTGKRKIAKALTGGKYDGMKGRKMKFVAATAKNVGKKGARLITRAGTAATLGSVGLMAGAITAAATGDVNNIVKGATIGTAAGWKNGKNIADWGGSFIDDTKALRAENDQGYADKIRIEEAKDSYSNNLTEDQKNIIEKYAPYVDFNGDEDKLDAFVETDKAMGGIEADNIERVIAVAKDSQRFGNLNESSKQEEYRKSLIKEKMNEENAKIGNEPGQVSEDEYLKKAGINADNLKEEANKLREAEEAKISDARRKELAEAHQAHDKKEIERVKKKYEKKYNELKSDESKQKFAEEAKKKALQTAKEKNINMDEIDKKIEVAKSHYNKVTK